MSSIRSTTGLASGIDIGALAESMVLRQRASIARFESRSTTFEQRQTAIGLIEANVLSLSAIGDNLADRDNWQVRSVNNSNSSAVQAIVDDETPLGDLSVRSIQLASSQRSLSKGYSGSDATLGTGQIVIRQGGQVAQPTRLEHLNGGDGVGGGTFRITNRDGQAATIDLTDAVTVDDVAAKIAAAGIDVALSGRGDALRLTDSSGGTGSLTVEDLSGGAASDLGLVGSVAADTLDGSAVFAVTEDFTLDLLSDGNRPHVTAGEEGDADLTLTASDGTTFDVVLDDADTIGDVIAAINDASGNGGLVTASLANDRLVLTDNAGGGGTLTVADAPGASAMNALGLAPAAVGNTLTGERLHAGIGSVLLRNLNGGAGIGTPGTIEIGNQAGETATIDLSTAETLADVVEAINTATTAALNPLGVTAAIDETGTGLTLTDTTAGAGTLTVIDTLGTTAADLGLDAAAAGGVIATGSLDLRTVNQATDLAALTTDGEAAGAGIFQITDSAGNTSSINVTEETTTVGELIALINADAAIDVTAALNETGDGIALIDEAGGGGTLEVAEIDGDLAERLRLAGDSFVDGDGKQRIAGRNAVVIDVAADDTLEDIVAQINAQAAFLSAELIDDGSSVRPTRLALNATGTGLASAFTVDDGGLDLGLVQTQAAADAVARIGSDPVTAFLVTSSSNTFEQVAGGVDVELLAVSDEVASITVGSDYTIVKDQIATFVEGYNTLMSSIGTATAFSLEDNTRGVLQGDGFVLRVEQRFNALLLERSGPNADLRDLTSLGVSVAESGKLSFDPAEFDDLVKDEPQLVEDFFADEDDGFGTKLDGLLDRLTNGVSGAFKNEKDSLQASIDAITLRVEEMNDLLAARQEQIYRQFVRMEEVISGLQAQQQTVAALGGIAPAPAAG